MNKRVKREKTIFLKRNSKKGQVWIETVIYTLIAFVLIGLILAYARPKIQELQDQAIIQQSIEMMKQIDSIVFGMGATGNQRVIDIVIKEGNFNVDGANDKIFFQIDSQAQYSEPGVPISDGDIIIQTQKKTGNYNVTLTRDYDHDNYDITFDGQEELKQISKASTAYKLSISNKGVNSVGKTTIDFSLN